MAKIKSDLEAFFYIITFFFGADVTIRGMVTELEKATGKRFPAKYDKQMGR